MLIRAARTIRHRSCQTSGFTLMETLVAMLCGLVVTGALLAILEVSMTQTARITGKVQATQLGRTTMTSIVDELRTACIAKEFTPIREKSSESELIFVSGVGQEAVLTKAYLHKISYSGGKLVDKAWASTGGEWPNFEFNTSGSATSTTQIGEYITQTKSTPVFQYYEYATSSSSANEVTTLNTTPLTTPLTKASAEKTAGVLVTFTAGASEGKQYSPTVELSNQVTLAFSAPSAETPILAKPCE